MTDNGILSDHAGTHESANQVLQVAQRLQHSQSELEHKINTSLATWSGEAQTAYHALQKDWNRNAADLQNVLKQIATLMGTAADSYHATDAKAARTFGA